MDPYWTFFAVVMAFPWLRYVVIRMEENYELEREALRKAFQETKQEPQPTPGIHSWEQPPWNPNLETEPGIERGDDSNLESNPKTNPGSDSNLETEPGIDSSSWAAVKSDKEARRRMQRAWRRSKKQQRRGTVLGK